MNTVQSLFFGTGLALLLNVPIYIRRQRLLRLAKARLELARSVTAMDKLMLEGTIKAGDVCHDALYQAMLRAQYATKLYFPWRFWVPPTEESKKHRIKLHKELSEQGEVSKSLRKFVEANAHVLFNSQPFVSKFFALYVLIFCGGLKVLIAGLISIVKLHSAYVKFKRLTAEWSLVLEGQPSPQFRTKTFA